MLPEMTKDADAGLTIYIQNESPGKELEANWLPAPERTILLPTGASTGRKKLHWMALGKLRNLRK